ncbi:MAG: hypothetical protein ACI9CQ_003916 [Saprospiraceae bacterium]
MLSKSGFNFLLLLRSLTKRVIKSEKEMVVYSRPFLVDY